MYKLRYLTIIFARKMLVFSKKRSYPLHFKDKNPFISTFLLCRAEDRLLNLFIFFLFYFIHIHKLYSSLFYYTLNISSSSTYNNSYIYWYNRISNKKSAEDIFKNRSKIAIFMMKLVLVKAKFHKLLRLCEFNFC